MKPLGSLLLGLVLVLISMSTAGPADAARSSAPAAGDSVPTLSVGESITGRIELPAANGLRSGCRYVVYTYTQPTANRVKVRYVFGDRCRGYTRISWATRTDRFDSPSHDGAVAHREFNCYTCHGIDRVVRMYDPPGRQKFQQLTSYLGLNGSSAGHTIDTGEVFYS